MKEWKKELAKSGVWVLFISHTIKILAFLSTIVLARLLSPADFGIVAMATAVVMLVEMLGDFGFHVYLVQKKDLQKEDLDTAWTFQVLLAVAQGLMIIGAGGYVASFYGEPRLAPVFYALGATVFLGGFRNIGIVSFQKDLKFHLEFFLRVPSKVIGVVTSLALAYIRGDFWALILGISSQRIAEVGASYLLSPYRPRVNFQKAGELFRFSKWLYMNTTFSFVLQRSPDLILGKLAGQEALGLFSVSHSVATLPTSEFADPIARATFPSYVKIRDDLSVLREGYVKVLSLLAFFSMPMGVGIAAVAHVLVPVLLGPKWVEAVPLLQMLALGGVLKSLQSNAPSIFLAQGKPWAVTGLWGVKACVLLGTLSIFCPRAGALGAAWAFLVTEALISLLVLGWVFQSLKISWQAGLELFARPCAAAGFMYVVVTAMGASRLVERLPAKDGWTLALLVLVGAASYLSSVLGLWVLSGRRRSTPESWLWGGVKSFLLDPIKGAWN